MSINFDDDAPVFAIAAAAQLAEMHPQTLRQYDRMGLVVPGRTRGGSRRYSMRHIEQLREVARLSAEGMSLPAIARIIELENTVRALRSEVSSLRARVREILDARPGARVFAAGVSGVVATVQRGARLRRSNELVRWHPHPFGEQQRPGA